MIQVDIFWAWAFGAMFAVFAHSKLKTVDDFMVNKYFIITVLWLVLFFAPSGLYLLWQFPHWESMQVFRVHTDCPAWLAILFGITNVTQGILGYYYAFRLIRQKKLFQANLHCYWAYFLMFYILVYGWDGTGWQRFLFDATVHPDGAGGLVYWTPSAQVGLDFAMSNVAITLYVMGIIILPPFFHYGCQWLNEDIPTEKQQSSFKIVTIGLIGVFGLGLGTAVLGYFISSLVALISGGNGIVGFFIGLPLTILVIWLVFIKKTNIFRKYFSLLMKSEDMNPTQT